MVRAVIKRREGKNDHRTAKNLGVAYQTIRGRLVHTAERGPGGLYDRHAPSRMRKHPAEASSIDRGVRPSGTVVLWDDV